MLCLFIKAFSVPPCHTLRHFPLLCDAWGGWSVEPIVACSDPLPGCCNQGWVCTCHMQLLHGLQSRHDILHALDHFGCTLTKKCSQQY
jgi:hypothetical protein